VTLQAPRNEVGDRDFFRILRAWAARKAGGNGTIPQLIRLAERLSGEQLTTCSRSGCSPAASMLERLSRQGARLRR
jgi:aminopeptidase N